MCGIVGKVKLNNEKVTTKEIQNMLSVIKHRGPDGNGIFVEDNIGLGHTLLKIQDLSDSALQPYKYGNYVLTYNGEIYNFLDLKKELISNGYNFESSSDTEVLIKYIDYKGIDKTLQEIEGCYAIALFDKENDELYLIRDKFGIKPLYYYTDEDNLIWASEIKSILQNENIKRQVDIETIAISLSCKLWMDPIKTLFKDIYMLEPGSYIKIDKFKNKIKHIYYKIDTNKKYDNYNEVITKFSEEFYNSIEKKLISKVPVAAFLSGGLDSSIVCKLLNDSMQKKLSTYTIKYDYDKDLDLNHAKKLSNEENFDQHNILISEDMYNIENIDKVTYYVEEILIDKVYIPMYFNYKAAKDDGYTVVVSGQGSDEPWLGYIFTWKLFQYTDENITKKTLINDYYIKNMVFKDKLNKDFENMLQNTMENYLDRNLRINKEDILNSYADLSIKTILHDLLMQEDKLAMANSVESRVPFVDNHRLIELAYNVNSTMKLQDGREKYIVRKFAEGKINNDIIEREKYPFPEPPSVYNKKIEELCIHNWEHIKKSKILNKILKKEKLENIANFTPLEQWWLLIYWRFEEVFKMEV